MRRDLFDHLCYIFVGGMDMNSFDENLKRLRILQNMSQEDLAMRMNITHQTVSGWEPGRSQPDLDTIKNLRKYSVSI